MNIILNEEEDIIKELVMRCDYRNETYDVQEESKHQNDDYDEFEHLQYLREQ